LRKASERKILRSTFDQKVILVNASLSRTLERYWAVWGLLAWSSSNGSRWYRRLFILTSLCCTVLIMINLIQQTGRKFENCAEAALSATCFLSLLGAKKLDSLIGLKDHLLERHAASQGFLALWNRKSMRRLALFSTLWICKAAALIVRMFTSGDSILAYQLCVSSAVIFQAGSFFAILHCALHVTTFLELMVDGWTVEFYKNLNCVHSADAWNTIQALMRRVASSIETIFLAVQASALIVFMCCFARVLDIVTAKSGDGTQRWWTLAFLELLPTLIMAVCPLACFARATAVTERGVRVPSVVNSLLVKPNTLISSEHQSFVSFIKNSDIGFYWKDSRLDTTVFMNYCYLCGAVISALFTTALKFNQKS